MLGITSFGLFHTLISLLALGAGAVALVCNGVIGTSSRSGRLFVWLTVASCVTGLFIFHHGGFGKPHVLSIMTLLILAIAFLAERKTGLGKLWTYISTTGFSLAFFLHFIPGFTETLTRLPLGKPWASGPEDPHLAALIGGAFAVFLAGACLQALRIRSKGRAIVDATSEAG